MNSANNKQLNELSSLTGRKLDANSTIKPHKFHAGGRGSAQALTKNTFGPTNDNKYRMEEIREKVAKAQEEQRPAPIAIGAKSVANTTQIQIIPHAEPAILSPGTAVLPTSIRQNALMEFLNNKQSVQ